MEDKEKSKDKDKELVSRNEADGSNRSILTTLNVSTISVLPDSSTSSFKNRFRGVFSNRNVLPVENPTIPLANPHPVIDDGNVVKDFTKTDPKISNLASVSCPTDSEGLNQRHRILWKNFYEIAGFSRVKALSAGGGIALDSKEDKKQKSLVVEELKPSLSKQKNKGLDGVSTCSAGGSKKVMSSNQMADGSDRSKVLSSSSFTKFFSKQTHKDKGSECANPEPHFELRSNSLSQPISTGVNISEASLYPMAAENEPSSRSMGRLGPPSSHGKISLREWLSSWTSEAMKAERLRIFRQVVQLVDAAHYEGIVLTDLRPSKFIVASPNSIEYTGSLAPPESRGVVNHAIMTRKRPLELDMQSASGSKSPKHGNDMKLTRQQSQFISKYCIFYEALQPRSQVEGDFALLEKKWYACPEELDGSGLPSSNIYSLGVLLFELLCHFESPEMHSSAMLDLGHRILPAHFLSGKPEEAGFCFWLLHPKPFSRPSTREILQSQSIYNSEEVLVGDDVPSLFEKEEDVESEVLLDFLASLKEQKQNYISSLLDNIKSLEADIKEVGKTCEPILLSESRDKDSTTIRWDLISTDHVNTELLLKKLSTRNMVEKNLNLIKNISQLGNAYFSLKSQEKLSSLERSDKALLSDRERWCEVQTTVSKVGEKKVDQAVAFFEGVCKFARYSKFEVCGTLWNGDLLNSINVICSLSFDRDENYIAAAGVSRKIKIFEFESLLNDSLDDQYSMVEMSNRSRLSCVCWNQYIQNHLASTDYDGVVQMWDASTGQRFGQYREHRKRAWSVDFSHVDPAKFASGSDDCSVKLWSTTERNSTGTIWNPANICCVQFSCYSSHLLAFGSADYKVYCYDLRHTKIPWCSLAGHGKAVSYVKFLDSETIVSASTDNTLKLWDLKKTDIEGPVSNACSLTFSGHTNEKNFVGLSVLDGYIACGSETNEVFAYYRSLPLPITSHKFGPVGPIAGQETDASNGQFVSSVCWRRKSSTVVAANSSGSIKVLRMV